MTSESEHRGKNDRRNRKRYSRWLIFLSAVFCLVGGVAKGDKLAAKKLFGAISKASSQPSASYGGYSKGCLAGAEELSETGQTWQAMRLSRNRNWGHPDTISFV